MYYPLPAHRESPLLVVAPLLRYAPDFKQAMHIFPVTALYKHATAPAERHYITTRHFSLPDSVQSQSTVDAQHHSRTTCAPLCTNCSFHQPFSVWFALASMATSSAVDASSLFTFGLIPCSLPHSVKNEFPHSTQSTLRYNQQHWLCVLGGALEGTHVPRTTSTTQAHMYNAPLLPQRYTHYHAALPQILHYAKPFSKATLNKEGTSNYHIHTHGASEQPACHTFTNEQHTAASLHPFWTDHRNNCHLSTTTKY